MTKIFYALVLIVIINGINAQGLSSGSSLRALECMNVVAEFYARVDGVFSNFNHSTSSQQNDQFMTIGNDLMTSGVTIFIYVPGGPVLQSVGISGFASLLTDFIAPVDCGEDHIFSFPVAFSDNGPCCNNITIWVDELSVTNSGIPNSPFGPPCGPQNGTAVLIPGRFEITCFRNNAISDWRLDSITEKFRANVATGLSWTPPGWEPMNLPDNSFP